MLLKQLNQQLKADHFFNRPSTYLIAVSGGIDSMVLLHALVRLCEAHTIDLHIASLNHGLRPDAHLDIQLVQTFADHFNLNFHTEALNLYAQKAENPQNLEALAREERYTFLARIAKKIGAQTILLAHHKQDQAETILMHLLRGSGLSGLSGMSFFSPHPFDPDLTLYRPLLNIDKHTIEDYQRQYAVPFRLDKTNLDTTFTRNDLRHNLFPILEQLNPSIIDALTRMGNIVGLEDDYLQSLTRTLASDMIEQEAHTLTLYRAGWDQQHEALQRRLLQYAVHQLNPAFTPPLERIQALITLSDTPAQGQRLELGENIEVHLYADRFIFRLKNEWQYHGPLLATNTNYPLQMGLNVLNSSWHMYLSTTPLEVAFYFYLPPATPLYLRTRQAGDKFAALGMQGQHRSLKKWMTEKRIPPDIRYQIPLLTTGDTIIGICLKDQTYISEPFLEADEHKQKIYGKFIFNNSL